MKKKILFGVVLLILIIIIITFFCLNTYKSSKTVNNIDKSNIKEYILNISSYEANIVVTVNSNKNTNKYVMEQSSNYENIYKQKIIEPKNINGLETIYDGSNLILKNTNLDLTKIYENYECITNNILDLYTFIQNYKSSENALYEEKDNEIIMKVENKNGNIYNNYQILYIDKNTALPTKMEIIDKNKNISVYIEYIEIKFNSTSKDEILAFSVEENVLDL